MENFSDQGFAASTAAKSAENAIAHVRSRKSVPHSEQSATQAVVKGTAVYGHVAKGERRAEEGLRSVQSKLMLPGILQFVGMILATPLMWATKKLPRVKTVIGSVFKASTHALEHTKISDIGQLPANYMSAVAEQAKAANVEKWAASATATSEKLAVRGEKIAKPLTIAITGAVEKLSQTGLAKAMPKAITTALAKVRGASIFQVMMTAGVAVGMGATLFGARAESKESKAAFKNLLADLGGDVKSPFAKAVKASYASKKNWGVAKTGLELAGGAAEGVMWAMPGLGGMALMGGMMIPQLCTGLVPDSPVLGAYVALNKAAAGELKLDTAAQIELVKQLVAIVPTVAAHGGQYNRLNAPIAAAIVEQKMSPKAVVQLLNNDAKFTAFADEVNSKQKAAKAAQVAALKDQQQVLPVASETTISGKATASNAPSLKVGGIEHQGTLHAQQQRASGF